MNIWFDLSNSPHVLFFGDLIREMAKRHHVILTCRPLANTTELLDLHGFDYSVVGRHYGRNSAKKLIGFPIRITQLYRFLRNKSIDVSISHSSYYSPIVSKMLGAPCIYLNDNEHAQGNRFSFLFADRIMVPEFLSFDKIKKQGASASKVIHYPGVKEGVYLWNFKADNRQSSMFPEWHPDRKRIFIRPEPSTAQYYKGKQNFIDQLLLDLKDRHFIMILPRGDDQRRYYKGEKFSGVAVAERAIALEDIVSNCDLFIGAGGTMTRESAVLGIPTISIYQDNLLEVDQYLIQQGSMVHKLQPDAGYVENFMAQVGKKTPNQNLLDKGHKAYQLIIDTLLDLSQKKR